MLVGRLLGLALCSVLCSVLLVVPPGEARPDGGHRARVVAAPRPNVASTIVDEKYRVEGRLPRGLARRPVELQRRTGEGTWAFWSRTRVRPDGRYVFVVTGDDRKARWRVVAPAVGWGASRKRAVRTRAVSVAPTSQSVTIVGLSDVVAPGAAISFSAVMTPPRPGRGVKVVMTDVTGTVRARIAASQGADGVVRFSTIAPPVFGPLSFDVTVEPQRGAASVTGRGVVRSVPAHSPKIVAHRGGHTEIENTIPAFEAAIAEGSDWLETDILQTLDGHWVLMHDADLRRTTDAASVFPGRPGYSVGSFTLAEVQQLSVGGRGVRVPTLREFLDLVARSQVPAYIEPKSNGAAVAQSVLSVVASYPGMIGPWRTGLVEIQSFDAATLRTIRGFSEDVRLGLISSGWRADITTMPWLDSLILGHAATGASQVEIVHGMGLSIVPWTVNDVAELWRLAALGVDGIITDMPARARAAVGKG